MHSSVLLFQLSIGNHQQRLPKYSTITHAPKNSREGPQYYVKIHFERYFLFIGYVLTYHYQITNIVLMDGSIRIDFHGTKFQEVERFTQIADPSVFVPRYL